MYFPFPCFCPVTCIWKCSAMQCNAMHMQRRRIGIAHISREGMITTALWLHPPEDGLRARGGGGLLQYCYLPYKHPKILQTSIIFPAISLPKLMPPSGGIYQVQWGSYTFRGRERATHARKYTHVAVAVRHAAMHVLQVGGTQANLLLGSRGTSVPF